VYVPPAAPAVVDPELLLDFDEEEHAASATTAATVTATAPAFSANCRFTADLSFEAVGHSTEPVEWIR